MRKVLPLIVFLLVSAVSSAATDTISIPLHMYEGAYAPLDGPTGSTPDPTDPNQFRASLVGNTLLISTQQNAVSFVVVKEGSGSWESEDLFYDLSYGQLSCPLTRTGQYTIHIGYWKTDFVGFIRVFKMAIYDINGRLVASEDTSLENLPQGCYFLRVETSLGTTSSKFYKRP